MAACKSCEAPMFWVDSPTGKNMPMDEKPDPAGQWVVIAGKARRVTDDDRKLHRETYTCHFATCVDANQHRRSR